jgi:hypothetical protein
MHLTSANETCAAITPLNALLDLLARLAGLLLDAIDDLVRLVACLVHVLLRELVELADELLLQLRCAVTDLLLEHVVKTHLRTSCVE